MIIARLEKAHGYKGVGRSGQGGQAALSLAGKQAGVLRSIVKQSVGPCKTEASQKPVPPRTTFGSDSSGLAALCALPSTDVCCCCEDQESLKAVPVYAQLSYF